MSMASVPDSFDPYGRPPTFMHSQHSDSPEGSPHPYPRSRQDSAPLLMLPAPLAISGPGSSSVSSSLGEATYMIPSPDTAPNHRLHRLPDDPNSYSDLQDAAEREPILPHSDSTSMRSSTSRNLNIVGHGAVIRNVAGGSAAYPGETPNPYRNSQPQTAAYEYNGYSAEVEEPPLPPVPPRQRGVSLIDPGPVVSPEGPVRRVPRSTSKRTSSIAPSNASGGGRYKHTSSPPAPVSPTHQYLPPGAAAPQPGANRYPGA